MNVKLFTLFVLGTLESVDSKYGKENCYDSASWFFSLVFFTYIGRA